MNPSRQPLSAVSTALRRRTFLRRISLGLAGAVGLGLPSLALAAPTTPTPNPTPAPAPSATPQPAATLVPTSIPTAVPTLVPTSIPTAVPTLVPTSIPTAVPTPAAWVQALRPIPLWSGPDDNAEQLGAAARWDYFLIVSPQLGARLNVQVARTRNYAWIDALLVGPSGPPPPGWPPATLATAPDDLSVGWVATVADSALWGDAGGSLLLGLAPPYTPFKQLDPQDGALLHVQDPYSGAESWLDARTVGPIDPPLQIDTPARWWGLSYVDGANIRSQPTTRTPSIGELPSGHPIVVSAWVAGEEVIKDNPTWAVLSDSAYVYSSILRPVALPGPPPPPDSATGMSGRWIDLNLLHQVVVAYEGQTAVRLARTSTGRPGWETAPGRYAVQRRVEKETMESTSLIGLDAQRADYKVENVRWTQYFSADGKALHENYWKPRDEFGIPSSHGCAGLVAEDAKFFWDWADIGVPIIAHI